MVKYFLAAAALIFLMNYPPQAYASESAEKPCQSKYLLKTETDECLDTGIENLLSPNEENNKTGTPLARFTCKTLAEGDWIDFDEVTNKEQRTLLHRCMMRGYLKERMALPEALNKTEALPNSFGLRLEENTIWFYTQSPDGHQKAGINIYNPKGGPISWIVVGFHPLSCYEATEYQWVVRLNLNAPLLKQEQAVLTWSPLKEFPLVDGCLDILAAG